MPIGWFEILEIIDLVANLRNDEKSIRETSTERKTLHFINLD